MRDTDRDWNIIAERHPFFGVLANEKFLGSSLDEATLREFYASGQQDIAFTLDVARKHFGIEPRFERALDFGCGVGRLSKAMAAYADRVTGIDVSPKMLEKARVHGHATNIDYVSDLPGGCFDWINSHIVFQHIPPERGISILRDLLSRATPGAFVALQFPFYRDRKFFEQTNQGIEAVTFDGSRIETVSRREQGDGAMLMYDYPWPMIYAAFVDYGFTEFHLYHTDHGGVHGAWVFSIRSADERVPPGESTPKTLRVPSLSLGLRRVIRRVTSSVKTGQARLSRK